MMPRRSDHGDRHASGCRRCQALHCDTGVPPLRTVGRRARDSRLWLRTGQPRAFGHDADTVPRADRDEPVAWTTPLHRDEADALVGILRTAAIIVILAVSGMRSSEVMELQVGGRRPPQELGHGLARYRLASRIVKGQPLGGLQDEWVVIEPVIRAVELAEQLHDDPLVLQPAQRLT